MNKAPHVKLVAHGLCIYVCKNFCEMLLSPLNIKDILGSFNSRGQFYDTVCIAQLMTGVRLFSEYLLHFITTVKDNFRMKV